MPGTLKDAAIRDYIAAHQHDDVRALALKPFPFDSSLRPAVLDQIKARQKAQDKIPDWAALPDVIFPPSDLLEQASSSPTAAYKAHLVEGGSRFVDLTAGAGIDSAALSAKFDETICIERDERAAELLRHNLPLIAAGRNITVLQENAENYVAGMTESALVFIDPQRREEQGRRGIFRLEDTSPDVTALLPQIKAKNILIKTSPMLDITQASARLPGLCEVHVIEWQRQCREVLYTLKSGTQTAFDLVHIHCVTLNDKGEALHDFVFTHGQEQISNAPISAPLDYIFEPGPAMMKGGAFNFTATHFGLSKLHPHTHLYTGSAPLAAFPGRVFKLVNILQADRKAVQAALPSGKAHLKLRNFPGEAVALQKKLGLIEGGEDQLFACTLTDGRAVLLQTRRTSSN